MSTPCEKHALLPVVGQSPCAGCEIERLRAENAGLHAQVDTLAERHASSLCEIEALRKDLMDWKEVVAAVKREVPERFTSYARGNAPGHGHSISGVWDDDNGALAGKECAWCKAWNSAMGKVDP